MLEGNADGLLSEGSSDGRLDDVGKVETLDAVEGRSVSPFAFSPDAKMIRRVRRIFFTELELFIVKKK